MRHSEDLTDVHQSEALRPSMEARYENDQKFSQVWSSEICRKVYSAVSVGWMDGRLGWMAAIADKHAHSVHIWFPTAANLVERSLNHVESFLDHVE